MTTQQVDPVDSVVGFVVDDPQNFIGAAELEANRVFLHNWLLATFGLDVHRLNIRALVKEFAVHSGTYSEARMYNIVGGCFLLHERLPGLKAHALEHNYLNYERLRTIWFALVTVSLDAPGYVWRDIDTVLVGLFTPTRANQPLPSTRRIRQVLRDTLIRLHIVEETPPEEELTEEAMAARITAMCGVELWESPHAGVSVLNVTLPSDEAHEIKQRLAAGAKKLNLREDEIITNRICGSGEQRDAGCTVHLFGLGTLTEATKVVPERLHGVGLLTGEQRDRISGRDFAYTNIGDVAEVLRAAHDPTEEQRLLIMGRDGTCRFPDCTMDATFCDIDHVINHEVGGWTTASNLQCLCRHHHNFKTDRHATASTDTYGNVTWRFATGATITTIPQGVLAGHVVGCPAGITTRHSQPTKTEEDYQQPPIREDFGRWGTTLINYRNRQRARYLARHRLVANIPTELPPLPEAPHPEPPPDDQWPQEPPTDYTPPRPRWAKPPYQLAKLQKRARQAKHHRRTNTPRKRQRRS
ncbi:hypothetical protein CCANI_01600 [Corynebacterium canis]|uniref:HNH endonuclease signature motif containing protein n=1 Tax=Corynebacterium canis TaxID=679663 RepID=UPI0025B5335B|nr:HNH endonuclease signature motif containing protein [Corynebacterium canis]WJY74178.1 hypothetical protein CCANI_01600 [Corynebacterium canis]